MNSKSSSKAGKFSSPRDLMELAINVMRQSVVEPRSDGKASPKVGAVLVKPDATNERKEFDDAAVMIPDLLERWLRDKLPNVFDRHQAQSRERPALPFEMVCEAVANEIIHRDYGIGGAKVQLVVTDDTITVRSPGGPPAPATLEQLQSFTAPLLSRNPELHYVFARMGMAEEQGYGVGSLRDRAQETGLPLPRYSWDDPYIVLTLYRTPEAATTTLAPDVLDALSPAEKKGWQWVSTHGPFTSKQYSESVAVPYRTAMNHIERFVELELVRPIGQGRARRYEVAYG